MMKTKTHEELYAELCAKLDSGYYFRPKPKPVPVVSVPVSQKVARAVEANPESVRIAARSADGRHVVEGARNNPIVTVRVDRVSAVDAAGRPVWPKTAPVHDYNPFDGLKR
jgi:hypothetical protein